MTKVTFQISELKSVLSKTANWNYKLGFPLHTAHENKLQIPQNFNVKIEAQKHQKESWGGDSLSMYIMKTRNHKRKHGEMKNMCTANPTITVITEITTFL